MAIQLTVGGTNIASQVERNTFRLEKNITSKVDTLVFTYKKTPTRSYVPVVGDEVVVLDGTTKVFAGVIVEHEAQVISADIVLFRVQCSDWTSLLDRKLVANAWQDTEISVIVTDILDAYAPDITYTNVETTGVVLPNVVFDYVRPSDAIRELAAFAGFDWWIDEDKDLHFVGRGAQHAPFDLADNNNSYIGETLVLRKSDEQLKNVIYVIGGDYIGNDTTDKLSEGDGTRTRFNLPYVYDSKPTVTVDSVSKTVGIELIDTTGYDCYWNKKEKIVSFGTAPTSGADIQVTGKPLLPLLVKMKAPDTARGEYEFKIVDRSLKTTEAVRARARAEIDAYADTIQEGTFDTLRSGLEVGQKIYVSSTIRGISAERYIIQQITCTMHGTDSFRYRVKLANVKAFEIVEFMRMLLAQGERSIGVIGDPTTVLNTIVALQEQVAVSEVWRVNQFRHKLSDTLEVQETLKMRQDYEHTFVWGDYSPTSIDDPKRVPMWDRGALWG